MRISYDPKKRSKTIIEREIDFERAPEVFEGPIFELEDTRKDYGEKRIRCFGFLEGRMVVVCYTIRSNVRHVFSMRKANEREQKKVAPALQDRLGKI